MKKITKGKKKGFTLIELIAVVAILAILAAIIIPNVINYIDNAKVAANKTEASTIYNAAVAANTDANQQDPSTGLTTEALNNLQISQLQTTFKGDSMFVNEIKYNTVITSSTTVGQLVGIMENGKATTTNPNS
ncbi:MAG: prepilin-type N-terminal cleavage/methylation domain-containing protein [Clostridium sp.]